jgi:hypothetical protein
MCDHTLTGGDVIARRARVGTDSRHFPAKEDLYRAIRPLFAPAAIECRRVRRKLAEVTRSDSNTWRRSVRAPRVAA